MPSRKEIVERELGVRIPEDYAAFLEKYGIYSAHGAEVYGSSESLLRYDGIPCVIGATNMHRRDEGLPHDFLVIHHSGIEDETICLNTKNGKVYALSWVFGNRKIADSFDEWFQRDIIEYYKRDRPNKYVGEKIVIIDKD
jgi:hypothetical protein